MTPGPYRSNVDDAEHLTEADDALDDDCTRARDCHLGSHLTNRVGREGCNPSGPVDDGELAPGRESHSDKFTWYPGDVVIIEPGDPEYEDVDDDIDT